MLHSLRPWITASVALTGAAFFVVPPAAAPLSEIRAQHRQVSLKSYDEFDFSQLATATTANIDALQNYFSSNPFVTDPDISQGLSTLFTDITTGQSNPVTNPISLLTEGALLFFGSDYGFNAASSALTGVADNVQSAFSSGDYSTALTDIEEAPSTVLYAFLNGYPDTVGNGIVSPEFGLLTSPDGSDLATGSIYAIHQIQTTLADELSALGGNTATTTTSLVGPGTVDVGVNLSTILNELAPSGSLTLPITPDQVIGDLAGANGDITVPITPDQVLSGLADGNGNITLPVTPDQLVGAVADANGNISIPVTPDQLIGALADANGNVGVPVTYDQILTDVLGNGGTISVPPISLSSFLPQNISVTLPQECISFPHVCVGGNTVSIADPFYHQTITPPALSDSTVLSDLTSALGPTGNQDISIPASTLDSIFGTTGGQDISIPASTLEQIFGSTAGNQDISIPVSTLENFIGNAGTQDLSVSVASLESLLGTAGSTDISIPLSTLESFLPSTLGLNVPVPDVTGTFPTFDVDLSQDLLSVLGSIAPISAAVPSLLTPDPAFDLIPLLTSAVGDLGLPIDIVGGDLPANLTGIVAEVLAGLVP